MSIPYTLEDFDVPAAVARMLDQPALWSQALALFVGHFAGWEEAWLASVGDDAGERRLVHALRSAAANVGATKLSASAAALDDLLLQGPGATAASVFESLRRQLQQDFRQSWRTADAALRQGRRQSAD